MMKHSVDIRSFFSESARSKRVELEINESESETEGESVDCHVMDSTSVSEVESTTVFPRPQFHQHRWYTI